MQNNNIIFIIVWVVWFISEIILIILLRSGQYDKKGQDKGSLGIVWITVAIAIISGVFCSINFNFPIGRMLIIPYTGLILIIIGMIFRFIAVWSLGRLFTVDVTIRENHAIKKDGLYKIIRHPSYSGMLLSFIGFGISLNNWISIFIITILVTIGLLYRIKIEEKLLIDQFGSEYKEYMKSTYRLIPFIY
jgi:protein-S-isoprenylcysteine O-methyltransferase Ste14